MKVYKIQMVFLFIWCESCDCGILDTEQHNVYFLLHHSINTLQNNFKGLILGLRPSNERRRYNVTPPLIGWAQT